MGKLICLMTRTEGTVFSSCLFSWLAFPFGALVSSSSCARSYLEGKVFSGFVCARLRC